MNTMSMFFTDNGNDLVRQITVPGAVTTTPLGTAGASGTVLDGVGAAVKFQDVQSVAFDKPTMSVLYIGETIRHWLLEK